ARDAVPGRPDPLDDVAEDAADLRDLLPRLDAVAGLDLQVDQPAAAGADGELVHRAQRVSADDRLAGDQAEMAQDILDPAQAGLQVGRLQRAVAPRLGQDR